MTNRSKLWLSTFVLGFILGILYFYLIINGYNNPQAQIPNINRYPVEPIVKKKNQSYCEYSQTAHQLGTKVTIKIQTDKTDSIETIIKTAFDRIHEIELIMSSHRADSPITKINNSGLAKGYIVPSELGMITNKAWEYSRLTSGGFDITVKPLLDLYKTAAMEKRVPTTEEIDNAKNFVNYRYLSVSNDFITITLANDNMSLDLGAIAKGYAIDEAAKILKDNNIKHALIEAGGDIRLIGNRFDGKDWKTGIQNPKGDTGEYLFVLKLSNCAICTSGNYARGYWLDGKQVSHIIDPRTGRPCDNIPSVSVISSEALQADVLATALSVLGKEGLKIIEKLDSVEAFLIILDKNNKESHLYSSGFKKYVIE